VDGHDFQVSRSAARWELVPTEFLHTCSRCHLSLYACNDADAEAKAKEVDA
jgi:hypothetical protein